MLEHLPDTLRVLRFPRRNGSATNTALDPQLLHGALAALTVPKDAASNAYVLPQLEVFAAHRMERRTLLRLIEGRISVVKHVSVDSLVLDDDVTPEELVRYHYYSLGTQIYLRAVASFSLLANLLKKNISRANHPVADSAKRNPENIMIAGGSVIIRYAYTLKGRSLAGPLRGEEGVLTVDIDLDDIVRGKYDLDVCGNYARPDIFQLNGWLAASDLPRAGRAYPYQAVVLVEPSLASPQIFFKHIAPLHPALVAATQMRRSKWSSRQEAASWFAKRRPWKTWDKRAVRAFVEHGLVDSEADGGVHLKCDPRQEALAFPDLEPHFCGSG
ncbi:CN hydrolase domain-containing protein [Mycena chlorophos]|uniref:CN hydrolase domain-containing protein n=1 Tax=Mycena chlorophos TaxID=658473 RepID=A0A8H6TK38_MYCCL|nr:CN hydrolase domain-containing protein [Mycena chlorophos]